MLQHLRVDKMLVYFSQQTVLRGSTALCCVPSVLEHASASCCQPIFGGTLWWVDDTQPTLGAASLWVKCRQDKNMNGAAQVRKKRGAL